MKFHHLYPDNAEFCFAKEYPNFNAD